MRPTENGRPAARTLLLDLIENNVFITNTQSSSISSNAPVVTNNDIFYNPDGQIKRPGDQFVNHQLANTFRNYIRNDKWAFYKGNDIQYSCPN